MNALSVSALFSKSLKSALIAKFGALPAASFVANNFNLRAYETQTISRETARKWLSGKAFPEGERLKVLLQWLNIDANEAFGIEHRKPNQAGRSSIIKRDNLFSQSIVDSLSSQIAVIDQSGKIIQVNKAWKEFALGNSTKQDASYFENFNYLDVCEKAKGAGSGDARHMANGIKSVLMSDLSEFILKYPCHAPKKKRWFVARVTRMEIENDIYAIISHELVSKENYDNLKF